MIFQSWVRGPSGIGKFTILSRIYNNDPEKAMITISNHQSTIDDPLMWSWIPLYLAILAPERLRWALGAREILFTYPLYSWFFSKGQVIPVARRGLKEIEYHHSRVTASHLHVESDIGTGIKAALRLLLQEKWIHIFAEGRLHQNGCNAPILPLRPGAAFLVWRYYEQRKTIPIVLPILIQDFYKLFPEKSWIPRFLSAASISIAEPSESMITDEFLASLKILSPQNRLKMITRALNASLARLYVREMCCQIN